MMKQKRSKGFTLVEMLACVVTLILLGLTGSVALNMATQSYWASVFESDSQLLESTIDLYIGDILRYSNEVQTDGSGKVLALTNKTYQVYAGQIELSQRENDEGGYFLLCRIPGEEAVLLINKASYTGTLYVEGLELYYDEASGIFTGEYTIRSSLLEEKTRKCVFSYRRIANL